MIKSLQLQNFQSHKKTNLDFVPGVNSIIGSSNSGKTAILRALYWTVYNRPSGLSFVSHWNRDKNDKPIKSTYVKVSTDKNIIERRKGKIKVDEESKEFNGYILDEEKRLEAIGQDVPEEVSKIFNLDSVNIQKQMDAPFLLSESAGEVARFFNQTIRLDLIDRVLSKVESKRREANKEKNRLEIEQVEIDNEIDSYSWLENAENIYGKIFKLEKVIENNDTKRIELDIIYRDIIDYGKVIKNQEVILSAVPMIDKINLIQESLNKKIEKCERLQNLYEEWLEQNDLITGTADFSFIDGLIIQIDELRKATYEKIQIKEKLENIFEEYNSSYIDKERWSKVIIELEKQLPNICPLCGNELKKEECKC